jgi:hypothetical protein
MADLEPRVKQLEEDVGILKGEIKSVLMEVRTTLLSQSNPFTGSAFANGGFSGSSANTAPSFPAHPEPARSEPAREIPFFQEESRPHDKPQQTENRTDFAPLAPVPEQQQPFQPPQQPVPLPVAPRRSWELNTLAMLLAWCQGNMVRLSDKEMTSLLSLARYGGLVDEELAGILLEISGSFDQGKEGRAATVSEYLLALHELHTVIQQEEDPPISRLRRVS